MIHVTCDLCGKQVTLGEEHRYVVKIEVFAAQDPGKLTESDLDDDNMEALSQMLREEDPCANPDDAAPAYKSFRYDLCPGCHQKFVRNPLNKDTAQKFDFSKN